MLRQIVLFLLAVSLYMNGIYAQENSPFASPIQAELVQENTAIQPGQPFWVALRLNVEKGWHFYWKNPGDAGLAPSVEWQLPPGFTAGALEWPYPQRFEIDSLVGFGYEGDVWLLVPITPPKDLKETSVKIGAKIDWLACDDASCLPGSATVKADLTVSPEGTPSSKSSDFAKARALLAGRFNVSTSDILEVAKPSLRHRMILNFEGEADGVSTDMLLDEVLDSVSDSRTRAVRT